MSSVLDLGHTVDVPSEARRFAAEVIELQDYLKFGNLADSVAGDALHFRRRRGYTIVATRHGSLPRRYQIGVMGFRLTQYLKLGWACPAVVFSEKLYWESLESIDQDDLHIIALNDATGAIIGYLSAAFVAKESSPETFRSIERLKFPVEQAHGIDISAWLPSREIGLSSVMEIKRFVKSPDMPTNMRYFVPLELVLGLMGAILKRSTPVSWAVGDLEMHVAHKHLKAFGVDTVIIDGTRPSLPVTDPMWRMYVAREKVLPFVGRIQEYRSLARSFDIIDDSFDGGDIKACIKGLMKASSSVAVDLENKEGLV